MTLAKKACKDYRIPLLAVLIFVIMSLVNKNFFTPYNIFTIADSISGYGIVALGFTFILLVGQLDISFGSVIALSACIFMMMLQAEMNFLLALLAAIAVGCACGAVTGFFVATFRLSPFIVSMTMQLAYKGIALTITNQTPVSVPHPVLQAINNIKLFNIFPIVFFFFLLLFLGAMNGLVLCDSLPWVFFFWEITTLCSFFLISHDGTREAKRNATRALWMNMVGGIGFLAAMLFMQKAIGTLSIQAMLAQSVVMHSTAAMLPVAFLCFAAFTKSAQLPFQSWLCGAMVAPTPVSALLHSSTMVKAGVYLVLRLSPAFAGTMLAGVVSLTGAFTFVAASALACGQSNGKKILAYSTIANLGLIIACAGMATPAAITAAILLIIFHAVSKGLLFLCVGTIEQHIGSRDIESMRGLYKIMPRVAVITLFGIVTMMLPPFGALLAKWIAIEASASAPAFMPVLVVLIAFGSALTVLFWARWAGLLLGSDPLSEKRPVPEHLDGSMSFALRTLLYGAILLSLFVPWIFGGIEQSIASLFGIEGMFASDWGILTNGRGLFAVYPMFFLLAIGMWYALRQSRKAERGPRALPYLSGIQYVQDGKVGFNGPLNTLVEPKSSNYYMEAWFGEQTLTGRINTIAIVLMVVMLGGLL